MNCILRVLISNVIRFFHFVLVTGLMISNFLSFSFHFIQITFFFMNCPCKSLIIFKKFFRIVLVSNYSVFLLKNCFCVFHFDDSFVINFHFIQLILLLMNRFCRFLNFYFIEATDLNLLNFCSFNIVSFHLEIWLGIMFKFIGKGFNFLRRFFFPFVINFFIWQLDFFFMNYFFVQN